MSVVYQTTWRSFFAASISAASAASAAALASEAITIKSNVNAGRWIGIASPHVRSGFRRRTSRARSLPKRTLIDWENLSQSDGSLVDFVAPAKPFELDLEVDVPPTR